MSALTDRLEQEAAGWYCLRSRLKQERLAAQCLWSQSGIEAFAPRIRFRRRTRRGLVWFVEAVFPGYLFARFVLCEQGRLVMATMGVAGIVRFGEHVPSVTDAVIGDLRSAMDDDGVGLIEDTVQPGDEVTVAVGPFMGLAGLVKKYYHPAGRVRILLEFMGRSTEVEVSESALVSSRRRLVGALLQASPG